MQYSRLGRSGLNVSRVSLGSWLTFGNTLDASVTNALVRRAIELGVNLLDTADVYHRGEGEKALGKAIAGHRRQNLVLASKCFFPMSDDVNDRGLSRKHIVESCAASLQRLGTDYLDLYQCHRPDPEVPIEETVMAMDDLIRQGKVLYWGVSYWPARSIVDAARFARSEGLHPPISNQPPYNLLSRGIESEVLGACADVGVGQIVFSPLAQGVLTGKYQKAKKPAANTRAGNDKINQFISRYLTDDNLDRIEKLRQLAAGLRATPSQVALAWCLRKAEVASVIVGASSVAQLEENVGAEALSLPEDALRALDGIFPPADVRDTAT